MPTYEYDCTEHGRFELRQSMTASLEAICPICGVEARRVISILNFKVTDRERLPLGYGAKGKYISHKETGGSDIFVPSWGAMEQGEVDDVTQGAIEKERSRVKKNSETKQRLQSYVDLAYQTPKGERAKTMKEAMK